MNKRSKLAKVMAGIMAAAVLGGCSGAAPAASKAETQQTDKGMAGDIKVQEADTKAETGSGTDADSARSETSWPEKAVSIICPAAPGGGTDTNTRLIAKYLTKELGQPVTVVNIAGSSGAMGLKEAKNAAPDGYTFVYFKEDTVTNEKLGVMDFGYKDLDMVANLFKKDMFLVGSRDIKDIATLTEMAKAHPGEVIFGGESGAFISILPHILNEKLDIDLKIVDGGQSSERLTLMVGQQINLTFTPMAIIQDYLETGDLNAVALISDKRSELYPDIPTTVEQGLDLTYNRFECVMGPKGIDPAVMEKMVAALKNVCENPEFMEEAKANGLVIDFQDADGLTRLMEDYSRDLEEYIQYIPEKQ